MEKNWKKANGEDLPEYGREVIVLFKKQTQEYELHDFGNYQVGVSWRPDPKGRDFTNWLGQKIHEPYHCYGENGWYHEGVVYWLDAECPDIDNENQNEQL